MMWQFRFVIFCLVLTASSLSLPLSSPSEDSRYDEYSSSVCEVEKALPSMSSGGLVFFLHIPKVRLLFLNSRKTLIHTVKNSVLTVCDCCCVLYSINTMYNKRLVEQRYVVILKGSNE